MYLDVRELRNFYYGERLGRAVQKSVRDQLLRMWPVDTLRNQVMVGFGFAAPMMRPYLPKAARVTALMPGAQGVMHWPPGMPNHSVLCDEGRWPVETGSVDRLVLLHGLDASDHPTAVLEECYRTLDEGGRAMFIVPNRVSMWARREGTPFSFSRPYSPSQLEKRLRWHGFIPRHSVTALYHPPSDRPIWRKLGPTIERIGRAIPTWRGGGVLMVEVEKQVPRPKRPGLGQIVSSQTSWAKGVAVPGKAIGTGKLMGRSAQMVKSGTESA